MSESITLASATYRVRQPGCIHLDFKGPFNHCRRQVMAANTHRSDHDRVFWLRDADVVPPGGARMVSFCRLLGRLQEATACATSRTRICNEYRESIHEFEVPVEEIDGPTTAGEHV